MVPQLGLHAHLGSAWLNAAIGGGKELYWGSRKASSPCLVAVSMPWRNYCAQLPALAPTIPCAPQPHAGALLLLYKLATFRRWNDELKYAPR